MTVIAALALTFTPSRADACASCGCGDPTLTAIGSDIPFEGRVRAYSGLRYWSAGTDAGGGRLQEARMDLAATWSATPWLVLGVDLPLQTRALDGLTSFSNGKGLGDLQVSARAVVFRDRSFAPEHLVNVVAGLQMPSAMVVRDANGNAVKSSDAQLGTGAWDPLVGAGYAWFGGAWSANVDLRFRLSTTGFFGLREGNATLGALGLQYQPWTRLGFRMGVESKYEGAAKAPPVADDQGDPASFVTFVSPALVAAVTPDFLLNLSFHVPVVDTGDHHVGPVLQLGATWDL
jgi:hypothetical protein